MEVLPNALVVPPKEKGLLAVLVLPNMPPEPIEVAAVPPKGLLAPILVPPKGVVPKVLVELPKGDAAAAPAAGAPP